MRAQHLEVLAAAHGAEGGGGDQIRAALHHQLLQAQRHRAQDARQPEPARACMPSRVSPLFDKQQPNPSNFNKLPLERYSRMKDHE